MTLCESVTQLLNPTRQGLRKRGVGHGVVRPGSGVRHDFDRRAARESLLLDQPEHIINGSHIAHLPEALAVQPGIEADVLRLADDALPHAAVSCRTDPRDDPHKENGGRTD